MNFTIKTIGCKVNTYESDKIREELVKLGFNYIDVEDKNSYKNLDFYIVNTCSVTKIADKKSRQMLHLAKKYNNSVKVIAIGCLVDSLNVDISDNIKTSFGSILNDVDCYVSNKEKNNLTKIIFEFIKNNERINKKFKTSINKDKNLNDKSDVKNFYISSNRVRAFIKIQDGCNQYCSYCIIPYLRGNIKSRNDDDIIKEINDKVKNGVKEVVLTGIHLSSFGLDRVKKSYENDGAIDISRNALLHILKKVSEINGVERIRLGSLEPRIINDHFIKEIAVKNENQNLLNEKFCANFCLSLQSGCDKTLKNMNRHYTVGDFESACNIIRTYMPNATITTDIIVGFPGESEKDFEESLSFVKKMKFYNPNIFPYSRRQGTIADKMDNQLSKEEKHKRTKIMIEECDKITKEIEQEYNKMNHDILIEEIIEENEKKYGVGYTREYIKLKKEL